MLNDLTKEENIKPVFTLLILAYHNEDRLYGMLDSIFKQDYENIKLVVSDDGSDDFNLNNVQSYIEENKGENIKSVIVRQNPQNMGTVKHVAEVVKLVEEDLFALSAADDRFYGETAISDYVDAFMKNPENGWLVAQTKITSADYKKVIYITPTQKDVPYFKQGDPIRLYSRWSRRGLAVPCCMAFRKSAVDSVGGIDLEYQYIEDWPLELKLLRSGNMPIFLEKVTAIHSSGGITNTNVYGSNIRKSFLDDKLRIFETETEAHFELLTPEDQKAYLLYKKEIMERQYFFGVDLPAHPSKAQTIALLLKKPYRIIWYIEELYRKKWRNVNKGKLLLLSQLLFVFNTLLVNDYALNQYHTVRKFMANVDFYLAFAFIAAALFCLIMGRYCKKRDALRKELVN